LQSSNPAPMFFTRRHTSLTRFIAILGTT